MTFLRATTTSNPPVEGYINSEHVVALATVGDGATLVVMSTGAQYRVAESVDALARRLNMG